MGIYNGKDFSFYISPKTGGTTIRSWLVYSETGTLEIQNESDGYTSLNHIGSQLIFNMGYYYKDFKKINSPCKVCIKRDPVERFLSCYTDKVIREKNINNFNLSIDELLDNWNSLKSGRIDSRKPGTFYLENHFLPQTNYIGNSKDYYDYVFDITDLNTKVKQFLEDKLKCDLPNLHTRKQIKKPNLNKGQIDKIKKIYEIDYENGWY